VGVECWEFVIPCSTHSVGAFLNVVRWFVAGAPLGMCLEHALTLFTDASFACLCCRVPMPCQW
jgi:hypothetical protein